MASVRFHPAKGIWFAFMLCCTVNSVIGSVIPDHQVQNILHELTELKDKIHELTKLKDKIEGIEENVDDVHEYMFGDQANVALFSGDRYHVPDGALSASSSHPEMLPKCSRIGVTKPAGCSGLGWHAATAATKAWIQVDLGQMFDIHAVATQGRLEADQWTLTYQIASLQLGQYLFYLDEHHGGVKNFLGNYDRNTVIRNTFLPRIRSRVVRLYPMTWYSWPTIRWELYGKVTLRNVPVST